MSDSVRRQFGDAALNYVESEGHARGPDLPQLIELTSPTVTDVLLDVGTCVGHTLRAFAPHVRWAIGLDITRPALEIAGRLAREGGVINASFVEADATAMPFANDTFDVATCRIVAHHFADPAAAFAEIARTLRPGGRFAFVDNYVPDEPELDEFMNHVERLRDPSHAKALSLAGWESVLDGAGLEWRRIGTFERRNDVASWLARQNTPADVGERIRAMMTGAPEHIRTAFALDGDGFLVRKAIYLATRPIACAPY